MGKKKSFTAMSDLINDWFDNNNYTQKRTNFDAFHNWDNIVGLDIGKNTKPIKFYKNKLVINVKNSAWIQELQYMKANLLEKIQQAEPDTKISDIILKIGPIKR